MTITTTIEAAPTALEQSIRDICAAHGLAHLGIGLLIPNDERGAGWSVQAQRWVGGEPVGCWMGNGTSISAALSDVIEQLPPVAELADEALQVAA